MKISIITVTYNSQETVQDTFQSVLSQNYKDIEYIIIDGKSNDKTIEIIKQYESLFEGRMKWISEKDQGIYDAMNKGIALATGDIIGILNSDDLFCDNKVLTDIVDQFSPDIDALYGNLYFVNYKDTDKIERIWKGSPYKSFTTGWHPAHPTFYVRRDIYRKYGTFKINYNVSADFELMLRFIEKYRIRTKYYNRYMVKMRLGGESTKSIKNIIIGNKNVIKAFKENGIKIYAPCYLIKRLLPKFLDSLKNKIK